MKREPNSFSARLRAATSEDHSAAETSGFITDLMGGRLSARDYLTLIVQYRPIYAALERGSAALRGSSRITKILDPTLDRLACIDADLRGLAEWAELAQLPQVVPATMEYAARIEDLASTSDEPRFLAHHYLRYLGDLSGGQAIGALTARHYDVPENLLSMWRFEGIAKPKTYKDAYRDLLDTLGPELGEDTVVDEAISGFRYNQSMFAQLGATYSLA